ncbi:MAG: DUF4936 family protein [Pseudomonadota bacterium]
MADLYIYYQVRDNDAASLAPRVRAMQAALQAHHGIAGKLMRRPVASDGLQTWMEIYPATPDGFDGVLGAAVETHAVTDQIHGARHTELFTDF